MNVGLQGKYRKGMVCLAAFRPSQHDLLRRFALVGTGQPARQIATKECRESRDKQRSNTVIVDDNTDQQETLHDWPRPYRRHDLPSALSALLPPSQGKGSGEP